MTLFRHRETFCQASSSPLILSLPSRIYFKLSLLHRPNTYLKIPRMPRAVRILLCTSVRLELVLHLISRPRTATDCHSQNAHMHAVYVFASPSLPPFPGHRIISTVSKRQPKQLAFLNALNFVDFDCTAFKRHFMCTRTHFHPMSARCGVCHHPKSKLT